MDPTRFDALAKTLATSTTRRATLAALLGGFLTALPGPETAAQRNRRRQHKRRQPTQDRRPDRGHGTHREKTKQPTAAPATRPKRCCADGPCTPGPGTNLTRCCFGGQHLAGATFRGANLTRAHFAGADLTQADFRGANLSGACLVEADLRGAKLGGANQQGAIYCRTQTDRGLDNSGCERGTACCPTELGTPQPCAGCATRCCSGTCCPPNATTCNLANLCCVPNCAGRQCGDDGCGRGGMCGPCPQGTVCDDPSGQCRCTAQSCRPGCCANDGSCQPGNTDRFCGTGGGSCANCTGQQQCHNGQCVGCTPTCQGKQCGPDGCGGTCGACPAGQRCCAGSCIASNACCNGACPPGQSCQFGTCSCDGTSCPDGCCDENGQCQPGTSLQRCGTGGQFCLDCTDNGANPGQACVAGVCVCNAASCPGGCCTGGPGQPDNACLPNAFPMCGVAGALCVNCTIGNECDAQGRCVCSPELCFSGCCQPGPGGRCQAGTTTQACGSQGQGCATCTGQQQCQTRDGVRQCVCVPDCKECGPDGCGGTCGTCPAGLTCVDGDCVCAPNCGGKVCGSDGCGGSCGSCPRGQTCEDGQCFCRPSSCPGCCLGGPDGTCAAGTSNRACGAGGKTCVACRPLDQCHVAGTCNPATGTCSNPAVPNGTPCTDGNPSCLNGRCCGAGHEVVHGGCFQISDADCSGCSSACDGCAGSIDGSPNFLCAADTDNSCSHNADCPVGQACQVQDGECKMPC